MRFKGIRKEPNMKTTIRISIRNVYGNDLVYPLTYTNELQALTGNKTLTTKHMQALKSMGFEFESIPESLTELLKPSDRR